MTTREQIIAEAKKAGIGWALGLGGMDEFLFTFYTIAFEAGRVVEREEVNQDAMRYRWLCEQNEKGMGYFHLYIGANGLCSWRAKHNLDELIDRARGESK